MQNKTKKVTTDMRHLYNAALKIFKTFNNQNPRPWINERDVPQNCKTCT